MSNNNNNTCNLVTVILMDQDNNISDSKAVVAKFDVICRGNTQATLMQLMIDQDIKKVLEAHNNYRMSVVDRTILERTGSDVKLKALTLLDLDIQMS
jgi:hypothetical protein